MRPHSHHSRGVSVGASDAVPQGKVLSIVVVKEEVVVSVVGRTIDEFFQHFWDPVVPVMNGDSPYVDKDIEAQVEQLVQGEEERVDVVGQTLKETIHRVESVAGKGSRDLPDVVRLM